MTKNIFNKKQTALCEHKAAAIYERIKHLLLYELHLFRTDFQDVRTLRQSGYIKPPSPRRGSFARQDLLPEEVEDLKRGPLSINDV
jgi:hypothetical protein